MKIGICTVTYNNDPEELKKYVQSLELAAQELTGYDTLFLYKDCGKPSKLNQILPSMIKIGDNQNIGYSSAANLLMKYAFEQEGVELLICSNPDGMFHYNTLKNLLECNALYHSSCLIEAIQFPEEHPKYYNPTTWDTAWASGCCLLIPKQIFQAIGLFDEKFFLYMEDVDYSWRARLAGFGVKTCPSALYFHWIYNRREGPLKMKYFYESGRYIGSKWANEKFKQICEEELINFNYYNKREEMPRLPDFAKMSDEVIDQASTITHFEYTREKLFNFAEFRW